MRRDTEFVFEIILDILEPSRCQAGDGGGDRLALFTGGPIADTAAIGPHRGYLIDHHQQLVGGGLVADIHQDIGNFPGNGRYNGIFHLHRFKEKKRFAFSNILTFFHFQLYDGFPAWGR